MTYSTIADIAGNEPLQRRITAAAAQEHKEKPYEKWTLDHRWDLASTPGWAEAWEYYLAQGPLNDPGADPGVITDGMILAAVQPLT